MKTRLLASLPFAKRGENAAREWLQSLSPQSPAVGRSTTRQPPKPGGSSRTDGAVTSTAVTGGTLLVLFVLTRHVGLPCHHRPRFLGCGFRIKPPPWAGGTPTALLLAVPGLVGYSARSSPIVFEV